MSNKAARKSEAATPSTDTEASAPVEVQMTAAQRKVCDELQTVSARIRYLAGEGYSTSKIAKLIKNAKGGQLRYQHARNVLKGPTPSSKAK